jgi:hypothetical protein
VLGLDQNGVYVLSALGITIVVLAGYGLYLRSRLLGLRRRREPAPTEDHSARNVIAAAPIATTAQVANSAKGPTIP